MFLAPCKDIQTPHTHIRVKGSSLYSVRDPLASFTNLIHSSHYFFEPVSPETLALSRAEQITQPHKVKPQTERRGGQRCVHLEFADLIPTGEYVAEFCLSQTKQCLTFKF